MSHIHRIVAIPAAASADSHARAVRLVRAGRRAAGQAQAPASDPPGRVARLSDASGQVWLFSQDDNEWVAVDRNRPLTSGDRIATDNDARAEITLGTTTFRLDSRPSSRSCSSTTRNYRVHLQRQRRRPPAQPAIARRVRARDRRRRCFASRRSAAIASTASTRAATSRSTTVRPFRRPQQRAAAGHGATRAVLARRERSAAIQHARAGTRCLCRLERRARARREPAGRGGALRLARDDRQRRSRPLRPVGTVARLRPALDAGQRRRRLGAVQRRPLGLGAPVGLDLGRCRAVGLRALPLWPLGQLSQPLVLGAWHLRCPAGLRAGAGSMDRRAARRRLVGVGRAGHRWAGSRWRRTRSTCRATARARATCARSTSRTSPTSPTSRRSSTT